MAVQYLIRFSPDWGGLRGRFLYLGGSGKIIGSRRGARRFNSEQEARSQLDWIAPTMEGVGREILNTAKVVADYMTVYPE